MPRHSPTDPWAVGAIRLRRVRGPRADGLVYWRATVREAAQIRQVWAGWARREDPELVAGLLSLAAPEPVRAPTVRTLLGAWRGEQQSRADAGEIAPRSLTVYVQALRYLSRGLGDVLLDRLDVVAVREYIRARQSGRVVLDEDPDSLRRWTGSPRTISSELSVLRAAWAWGRRRDIVPDRALELPDHRSTPSRDKYTPTPAEVAAVLEALTVPWARTAVVLLSSTGLRIGELVTRQWRHVDLERGYASQSASQVTAPARPVSDRCPAGVSAVEPPRSGHLSRIVTECAFSVHGGRGRLEYRHGRRTTRRQPWRPT